MRGCGARSIDRAYRKSRGSLQGRRARPRPQAPAIGTCSIEGEAATLNEWLVREGWAIKFGPSATGRFAPEEADARKNRRGLWSGCFAEPLDFRRWNSVARGLWAAVASLVIRTGHASNYSRSTPPCRRDARSRPSLRCGPSVTKAFIICRPAAAITPEAGASVVLLRGRCFGGGLSQGADVSIDEAARHNDPEDINSDAGLRPQALSIFSPPLRQPLPISSPRCR